MWFSFFPLILKKKWREFVLVCFWRKRLVLNFRTSVELGRPKPKPKPKPEAARLDAYENAI